MGNLERRKCGSVVRSELLATDTLTQLFITARKQALLGIVFDKCSTHSRRWTLSDHPGHVKNMCIPNMSNNHLPAMIGTTFGHQACHRCLHCVVCHHIHKQMHGMRGHKKILLITGLEPVTFGLLDRRSNRLSYTSMLV